MLRQFKSKDVLYFIDEAVSDVETIVRAIPASAEVKIIGSGEDGLAHILAALAGKRDISAIHLFSHGRPGAIVLGASVIDTTTLTTRAEGFIAIGQALAPDSDLLIYGCNVAEGEAGKAFITQLADLTGANVAASDTPTGAAHLGGDWNLGVRLGSVKTPLLNIPSYAGVLAAPGIGGLSPITYTEDGAPQTLGSGVTFSGGLGYAGGSITFDVSGANSGDQLALFSDTDPNATGAISVDASGNVYLGNGTGRDLLGTVDATENGQNGQPLTVHFIGNSTGVFNDSSFESDDPTTGWQSEWTVVEGRVRLGTDPIAGWPSPADTTHPIGDDGTTVSPGDGGPMTDPLAFSVDVVTGGANASDGNRGLRLHSQDDTTESGQANSEPYGTIHGPYVYSDAFAANAGDILRFDWKAEGGDDAFDAFGYLLNADTGETIICLNQSGASTDATTPWATAGVIVPSAGNWQFVFVSGSFDYTGGQKTGGSLYIDNFSVQRAVVNDAVLGALAQHVQYETTSDTPPDAPRTITVDVADGISDHKTANTTIDITPANDAAVLSPDTKDLTQTNSVLSTNGTLTISDVDSPATFVPQTGTVGQYGSFSIGTNGTWTYVASSAHAALKDGEKVSDVFEVVSADGTKTTVTVNITGTNDAAQLSSEAVTLTEGDTAAAISTTGQLTITDVDSPATFVAQSNVVGQYGTFAIGTDGKWTYAASSAHDEFQAGQTYTDTFTVTSADGTTTTVTVNLTGTNDAAVLSSDTKTLIETDSVLSTNGQLTITDVDSPATFVAQSNVAGQYGTFAVGTDGKWTYVASSAHDEFEAGQTYTDSFTVTSADGTTTTVTVNLTGTNDTASGGVDVTGEPTQGKELTATNDVVDAEGIDPSSVVYQWQRQQPDGSWVNIIGAMGANYTLTQDDVDAGHVRAVMTYTDLGGTSETVAGNPIPVANVNDVPTGAVTITGEAREGQLLTAAVDTLTDEDGLGTLTYQWMADGVAIQGATGTTLTLTPDQVGKAITVVVSYTDGYGSPESVASPATPIVAHGNAGDDQFSGGSGNDQLFGGTGEDLLYGYSGRDKLFGEAGNDTIDGGSDNDTIDGGSGDDQLFGNSGKDHLYGNEGRDKLLGGASNDTISGGADDDTLDGGTSNDRLYGDSGNDALKGGSGNDWIVGGLGRDKLYGGSGADVFDFNSTQESRVGSQRDTISDFQSGRDLIDLRGIDANEFRKGNQAFTWSCMDVAFVNPNEADSSLLKTGFTGKAGQLRYDHGILMGDTDGDRKADFQIKIVGHFSGGDLIL
jgi:VCBS repeat-containing protein